ncbi:efflux RND transporter permease subunit [Acidithiobacillus ferrivorans]|uniref:Efflux RND transporter permease subunit n=1 Tax=Acidithiobacillus ferrivorans TaxID=160808 RepID=A0A7T4WEG2_9PROT|nr:efflux RND transporter permease subunit [Acidithiobacillus ferrivorans]QQD73109.1 efflux RND transporter permease subunit [Acidithiobacillus ferrivorans]
MNFSALFIRRPVMTVVLILGLVLYGIFAFMKLPVALLPSVDFPTVMVAASLPGASPQTMASAVATPLEKQFSAIPGLSSMSSVNNQGSTRVILQFDLSQNINVATQNVENAVTQASHLLPPGMPSLPFVKQLNPSAAPIEFIALAAPNMPIYQLNQYAVDKVVPAISGIPGVAQVLIFGEQNYAVRIHANPFAMQAHGISLQALTQAISSHNVNLPQGTVLGAVRNYAVNVHGQLHDAQAFASMPITFANGAVVPLANIAQVSNGVDNDQIASWLGGQRALILAVVRQPNADTVAISDAIQKRLPLLSASLPGGAHMTVVYDKADYIRSAVEEVEVTLLLASILVAGVLWLFLRRGSPTLIGALAIPASILGTFAIIYALGYTLNTLTLLALTLAVGFVVDDAVVMLENIARHEENGEEPYQAAIVGSREIGFTVISMTLSLAVVFLPFLVMGGIIGRLFREFGVTIAVVILLSGLVSLTLTPMLCARYLRVKHQGQSRFESGFLSLRDWYGRSLRVALSHRGWVYGGALLSLLATIGLFILLPKGFIPTEDSGMIMGNLEYPQGISFAQLETTQKAIAAAVGHNPAVQSVLSSAGQGAGAFGSANTGRLIIRLKPLGERASGTQVIGELRSTVSHFSGVEASFQLPPAIQMGPVSSQSHYQYILQSEDQNSLNVTVPKLVTALRKVPGLQAVNSDLQLANPEIEVHILHQRAQALGVTPQAIEQALNFAFGGTQVGTIYASTNQYEVILDLARPFQENLGALSAITVPGSTGLVPLAALAHFAYGVGPLSISHYNGLPSVTISFNLAPGTSLGDATRTVQDTATKILPADVQGEFGGSAAAFSQSTGSLPLLLLATVALIYAILAILYEDFIHPLTILTALPLAGFGALLALWIFHQELDLFSFVGIIMLVGLVKKNGIIMVDFAIHRRREGASAIDAMVDACVTRFRPIMMTNLAAVLGILPIAIGIGAGAESRVPLGVAVAGGIIVSQFLTLYVTPAFYVLFEGWKGHWKGKAPVSETASHEAM